MSGVSSMVTYARPEKFRKSIHHKWIGTVINSHIPDVAIICGSIVHSCTLTGLVYQTLKMPIFFLSNYWRKLLYYGNLKYERNMLIIYRDYFELNI